MLLKYLKYKTFPKTFSRYFSSAYNYQFVKVSTPTNNVGLIQLNRPTAKNALSSGLIKDLNNALKDFDENDEIGSIVLYGEKDYFAAGADIKEMKDKTLSDVYKRNFLNDWNFITQVRYL
jgi:enoyl-CoA hydratase